MLCDKHMATRTKHFYIVEILRYMELIKHRVIFSNMFIKKTKHMNFVVVTIDNFLWIVFWTESRIRGDPDRVGTTRPDPEHESPSHRPLFLPDWTGTV
jgi:hypothetical protein